MNANAKRIIAEAHATSFPGPSQDPADYAIDAQQVQQTLAYLKQRFVHQFGEEAWEEHLPGFTRALLAKDPDVARKMKGILKYEPLQRDFVGAQAGAEPPEPAGLGQGLEQQAMDTDPEHRAMRAVRDEPGLRRGESLVKSIIGKPL